MLFRAAKNSWKDSICQFFPGGGGNKEDQKDQAEEATGNDMYLHLTNISGSAKGSYKQGYIG